MSLPRFGFDGTAVLTGAAGGIGAQLAYGLARRGSGLVLVDRDTEGLDRVVDRIRTEHDGLSVTPVVVDLADHAALDAALAPLATRTDLRLVINNAGVALAGEFAQLTLDEFDWVIMINFLAAVRVTHHLLPALSRRPGGHLVNVSSLFGLVAPAGNSAYCASKFALRGFSESLRAELAGRTGVTTVHPGGIRTGIARNARVAVAVPAEEARANLLEFDTLLTFPAERAAEMILTAVERRTPRLLIGASATLPDLISRITPVHSLRVLDAVTAWATRVPRRTPAAP